MSFADKLAYAWELRGLILKSLGISLLIALGAVVIGFVIGVILAVIRIAPKTNPVIKILDGFAQTYITVIRGTPTMVQLLIMYSSILVVFKYVDTNLLVPIIAFGINSGAYMAEIIRAGINSVDKGQMEAGRAVGLSYGVTMWHVILPQSARNILPPLGNEAIVLVKETSVALIIGVQEFFTAIKGLVNSTYNVITPYLFAAIVYFITVFIMSLVLKLIERRLGKSDRK